MNPGVGDPASREPQPAESSPVRPGTGPNNEPERHGLGPDRPQPDRPRPRSTRTNGQVTAIAVNPNNPNIIYIGTAWGGVWLTRDGGVTWTPIVRSSALARRGRTGRARDRSGQHQHSVCWHQQPRRLAVLRRSHAAASGALQVDRRRRELGPPRLRLSVRAPRAMRASSSVSSSTSSSSIRPTTRPSISPANFRPVRFPRWRLQLDPGRRPRRRRALPGVGYDVASRRSHPVRRHHQPGVVQSTDGGQTWTCDPQRRTPRWSPPPSTAAAFGKVVVALAPPTSSPHPGGIQVLYATMVGTGRAPPPVGVFQSTDQGTTWTARAAAGIGGIIASHPGRAIASSWPSTPHLRRRGRRHHLFRRPVSGAVHRRGRQLPALNGLHADTHAWTFLPQPGPFSVVYCGNDGGTLQVHQRHQPSRRSTLAAFRPRCFTTSTSSGTRRRA